MNVCTYRYRHSGGDVEIIEYFLEADCVVGRSLQAEAAVRVQAILGGQMGIFWPCETASLSSGHGGGGSDVEGGVRGGDNSMSFAEAKKLMRLVNVEALKRKLGTEGKEMIGYSELLKACERMGIARSHDEAVAFARVLDDAGVVLLFRDKVYLHPDKVVDLIRRALPLGLTQEDDPRREELKKLLEKKVEIDMLAHKQARRILWSGLVIAITQVGLFFRLTFWEFSWDVMEPIAFFSTTTGILIGYFYFMLTSRDPTYQDLMKKLLLSRQRKLIKKHNFDVNKLMELQNQCKFPLDGPTPAKQERGLELVEPKDRSD